MAELEAWIKAGEIRMMLNVEKAFDKNSLCIIELDAADSLEQASLRLHSLLAKYSLILGD